MGFIYNLLILLSLSLISIVSLEDIDDNISNEIPDFEEQKSSNGFDDLASAAAFIQSGAAGDILSSFIQADGGKTMESLLVGAAQNPDMTNQILSGIGEMLNQKNSGAAIDPNLIGNVLSSVIASNGNQNIKQDVAANMMNLMSGVLSQKQKDKLDSLDLGTIASYLMNVFTESGENPVSLLMSSINSFFGPDAVQREHEHAAHANILPPIIEKAHLYFDHFRHTELYNALWRITGLEKFFRMFSIDGKFNIAKFFEYLENKSFRKHWINIITRRITDALAFITDSSRYKKYINTAISIFNSFLKSADFPKSTLFDISRPTETLTKFVNYFLAKYLSVNMDSRQYVQPAVKYVEDILRLAHDKGILVKDGVDSRELAHKLTDTINLEIIEPLIRVWRAYRFAKKVPECDKYVMCLINQEDPDERISLPGLKIGLSRTASMFASWFLTEKTGTSFWTFYSTINDEKDCSVRFVHKCNDFHVQEVNVDKEYTHTEL